MKQPAALTPFSIQIKQMDRGWGVVSFIQYVQLSVFNNTYKLATIGKDSMITSSNMYLTVI